MNPVLTSSIQSTAGAVPVKNEKGEISMQKVKVHRYVSGKRPNYAPLSSSEEDEDEDFIDIKRLRLGRPGSPVENEPTITEIVEDILDDPRLRRLRSRFGPSEDSRHIHEPEVVETRRREREASSDSDEGPPAGSEAGSDIEEGEYLSDAEIERRRNDLRMRVLQQQETQNDDVLACEEEGRSPEASSLSSSSEYEEYSDSEGEEVGPRLKPVFVRRRDRVTVLEREREAQKAKASELEARRQADEKRKQALRLVEEEVRKDSMAARAAALGGEPQLEDVDTDTDNDEAEFEAWKLRELRRVRRDREERENIEKERIEIERLRSLTEEERRAEMRSNPRQITNKAAKGKYKFLQKYYHRGAFYMDADQELLRRDFSAATLEDHFDKTVLPKVMQVKNFGRSGRTKYTHLVDQDTTQFDSPWISETAQNLKFATTQAAGMKQVFDRPSQAKRSNRKSCLE